ncbi:MAG TPA: hypothetical protein PKN56_24650 [Leptospiraceae bacterium]|nr:hypothetical protein [Leptospiraceae bacterium]HNF27175.1 hypothetical protein [Leptospiraceae bacterium]HNN06767.1 hypothetical protein [Leptospiraceae bacterium]
MSDLEKRVLERASDGGYQFTSYGEFLSYYHAHLQLFNKYLTEKKDISQSEKDKIYQRLKGFMVTNVKKTEHFFEKNKEFAAFLNTNPTELTNFLNHNFISTLQKVQDKLKHQEIDKLKSGAGTSFTGITDEINYIIGEIFPSNGRFVFHDGLISLEDITTGEVIKPKGLLGTIKEEREREEQKKQEALAKRNKPQVAEQVYEDSILKQIIDEFPLELSGERLELKEEVLIEAITIIDKEEKKPKGLLDDVDDLSLEDTVPRYDSYSEDEQEQEEEPGLLDDIEEYESSYQSENSGLLDDIEEYDKTGSVTSETSEDDGGLGSFLDDLDSAVTAPEPVKDEADLFSFKLYSDLNKKIFDFKSKNDMNGYNAWLASSDSVTKSYISIRSNLSKESAGTAVDWNSYYASISSKAGLSASVLGKLKTRIVHLDKVKSFLDICVNELKKQPAEVLSIMKFAWPHILEAFGTAPDYDEVEKNIRTLMEKVKNDSQRQPIEKILFQAISKLRSML